MSDSLRDQLLKAGFDEPKTKPKPARKPSGNSNRRPGKKHTSAGAAAGASQSNTSRTNSKNTNKANANQPGQAQAAHTAGQSAVAKSNAPIAGYTHVKPLPAKKKKKQKAPAIKPRASSWGTKDHTSTGHNEKPPTDQAGDQATDQPRDQPRDQPGDQVRDPAKNEARAQEHKERKEKIEKLIKSTALKNYKGEEIYRFTIKNKIRELLVSEPVRKQLANSEMAITRLNGALFIVPTEAAISIREINPQWVVFIASDASDSAADDEDFPVPDDLVW